MSRRVQPSSRIKSRQTHRRCLSATVSILLVLWGCTQVVGADASPQVTLDAIKAGPRAVESLTERSILRDYGFAWANLAQALEFNSTDPLNGSFVGNANATLHDAVLNQLRSGLSSRYLHQTHKLEAVFYAPEGDVIELHDTAEYDLQLLDGDKTLHDERVKVHYVVLMTPGADRWVIRQLQAVP